MKAVFLDRDGTINAGTKTILVETGERVASTKADYRAVDLLEAVTCIAEQAS